MSHIITPDKSGVLFFPVAHGALALGKDEILTLLHKALNGRCNEAWIFGSVARGSHTATSDIDLFIVTDTDLPFPHRVSEFSYLLEELGDIDILVYTPGEFKKLTDAPTVGFWRSAVSEMEKVV